MFLGTHTPRLDDKGRLILPAKFRDQLAEGVWTVSAGNAAQGVALAARMAGAACSVLVPDLTSAARAWCSSAQPSRVRGKGAAAYVAADTAALLESLPPR